MDVSAQTVRQKENSPFLHLFVLFKPSTDWMRASLGRSICFTQFTSSNANLMGKRPHKHSQSNVSSNMGTHDPVKLT